MIACIIKKIEIVITVCYIAIPILLILAMYELHDYIKNIEYYESSFFTKKNKLKSKEFKDEIKGD